MDGLLNWWNFDQILGETVVDSTGNHNGTLHNISPDARTVGIDGLGLPFTGSANERYRFLDTKEFLETMRGPYPFG